MRLATWNCARGPWTTKRSAAESLGADVVVVTEAPKSAKTDGLQWFGNQFGQNGITVLTSPGFCVDPLPQADLPSCVLPFRITGLQEFTLLAVWTWPKPPYKNYKEPLLAGLEACQNLSGPFVIAGDLNGNVCFDRPRSRVKWHSCFAAIERFGVVSAYHTHFEEPYGQETRPTQYQTRKESMPFHLDYVFIPAAWQSAIREVRVPGFASRYAISDHRPVVVDIVL